jgi:predicted transcriptional regulator
VRSYIVASSFVVQGKLNGGLACHSRQDAACALSHDFLKCTFLRSHHIARTGRYQAMAVTGSEVRMRFLDQAADALAVTAPTVSSYIRSTKRKEISSQDEETSGSQNVCSACGRTLLVGWSCELVRSAEHRQTRQQRMSGNETTTKCVRCSACGTQSMIHQKKKPKITNSSKPSQATEASVGLPARTNSYTSTPLPEPGPAPMQVPTPKEKTPEPPQAKPAARRKARNKNASLQALLANKKPEAPKSSGYGLDFMDFMK